MVAIDRLSKAALTRSLLYWISLDLIFQGIAFECSRLIGAEARSNRPPLFSLLPLYLNFAIIEIDPLEWKNYFLFFFFFPPLLSVYIYLQFDVNICNFCCWIKFLSIKSCNFKHLNRLNKRVQ